MSFHCVFKDISNLTVNSMKAPAPMHGTFELCLLLLKQ